MDARYDHQETHEPRAVDFEITQMWCAVVESFSARDGYGFARQGGISLLIHGGQQRYLADGCMWYQPRGNWTVPIPNDVVLVRVVGGDKPGKWRAEHWVHVASAQEILPVNECPHDPPWIEAKVNHFNTEGGYGFADVQDGEVVYIHGKRRGRLMADGSFQHYPFGERGEEVRVGDIATVRIAAERERGRLFAYEWYSGSAGSSSEVAVSAATTGASTGLDESSPAVDHTPVPAQRREPPRLGPSDEIEVTIKSIKRDRTSYGSSETYGQILIPWSVLLAAGITSKKVDEVFVVRCIYVDSESKLQATHIRRR